MNAACDLVVVGGGPAGTAAGIHARMCGLSVTLLEAQAFPRQRPGETLHPGIEPIFRQMGVADAVSRAATLRPSEQVTTWGGVCSTVPYGRGKDGVWRAFQIMRSDLDQILIDRFQALGGVLIQPARRFAPIVAAGRVLGVSSPNRTIPAFATIDATGSAGFLRKALTISQIAHSPRLIAHYGHRSGVASAIPTLTGTSRGWTWLCQVDRNLVSWATLDLATDSARRQPPGGLEGFPVVGRDRSADVSWRRAERFTGPGFFLVGDAATVLDPAAGHGVLRAVMSGMMAAHEASNLVLGHRHPERSATAYESWLSAWFEHDLAAMRDLYRRIGVEWCRTRTH